MTVLVIGAFSFIGYEIVQQCMKKGRNVYGIQPMPLSNIHEEKWLGIGRNANFTFLSSLQDCPNDVEKVYICLYEPHEESPVDLALLKEAILKYPQSILISSVRAESEHSRFSYIEKQAKGCMIIRVPTVYGPWQPEEMGFHRVIAGNKFFSVEEEEILFVDDVARTLLELEKETGIYTLTAENKEYWQEAYYHLTGKRGKCVSSTNDKNKKLLATNNISIEKGIEEQREHMKKYKGVYEKEMDK